MFFMSNPAEIYFFPCFSSMLPIIFRVKVLSCTIVAWGLEAGRRMFLAASRLCALIIIQSMMTLSVQRQSAWRKNGAEIEKTCNNLTQAVKSTSWGGLSCKNFLQGSTS
jgi:hypothetical protein